MRRTFFFLLSFAFILYLQGCLTVETKEYSFKIKKDGSGSGTIRYINIMTDSSDSANIVEEDYRELIDNYLNGSKLENEYPRVKNVKKKLFEEDNQLVGELSFDFDNIKDLKFYRYSTDGPWAYHVGGTQPLNMGMNETYFSSNGTWGGENMPVIFWDGKENKFEFKTTGKAPDNSTLSLISLWKQNGGR